MILLLWMDGWWIHSHKSNLIDDRIDGLRNVERGTLLKTLCVAVLWLVAGADLL